MNTLLAVDVSKDSLESGHDSKTKNRFVCEQVPNDELGIELLLKQCKQINAWLVVEATGCYHIPLVLAAQEAQVPICVLNPAQVRGFARSIGQRSKTDRLDAKMILGCAKALQDNNRLVPLRDLSPELLLLKRLLKQRELLVKNRGGMSQAGISSSVIKVLSEEIQRLDTQIRDLCRNQTDLYDRLLKTPFIGPVSASYLVALLWEPAAFASAKAVVAYIGLDVVLKESGRYKGKSKLSKRGWAALRQVLVAGLKGAANARCKNVVSAMCREYMSRDQNPLRWLGAACAVARKLLETAWSMAIHKRDFDPQRFNNRDPEAMAA